MSLGIVMMVHEALGRAEQVARHFAGAGCPVVIHVDKKVPGGEYTAFTQSLGDLEGVVFCRRFACEWGTWSLVQAAQAGAEEMLLRFPEASHVYLASGSCLPLRPLPDLISYLAARPQTDFIESATISDVAWTVGGLSEERFQLRFPLSWRKRRWLFDRLTDLQRKIGYRRAMPRGIVPHLGSQWWCLTRRTLSAILTDPDRPEYDHYFSQVWIPDESYFQTLVRRVSQDVESRSLTLSKFDFQGKPHVFYDDHLQLLRRSDCFMARKIWPEANALYDAFLGPAASTGRLRAEPQPGKIDRVFTAARVRRTRGRAGLWMQSRYPREGWENGKTAAPFSVFEGFDHLFDDWLEWLPEHLDARVHGHLFAEGGADFADGGETFAGCLPAHAAIRDRSSHDWLRSLIWNARGERQCFQFGPFDFQPAAQHFVADENADISVITGAWAIPLFRSRAPFDEIRRAAAAAQKTEGAHLEQLRAPWTKSRVRIWTLADVVQAPMEPLQDIIDEIGPKTVRRLTEAPRMTDLSGFPEFLQALKNQGMHPHLVGDFPSGPAEPRERRAPRPYIVS